MTKVLGVPRRPPSLARWTEQTAAQETAQGLVPRRGSPTHEAHQGPPERVGHGAHVEPVAETNPPVVRVQVRASA